MEQAIVTAHSDLASAKASSVLLNCFISLQEPHNQQCYCPRAHVIEATGEHSRQATRLPGCNICRGMQRRRVGSTAIEVAQFQPWTDLR